MPEPSCITCGRAPAHLFFEHGEDGPYCYECVAKANAADGYDLSPKMDQPATGSRALRVT